MLTLGQCVHFACIFEATARKAGNVHRFRDFADLSFTDFMLSAATITPVLEQAAAAGVGSTVLEALQQTQRVTATNVNLGIVLLLAPLAAAARGNNLRADIAPTLQGLTVADTGDVFAAIRLAAPGGLGTADQQDVNATPTMALQQVMALAAERDLIARQYATDFRDVFNIGVPMLVDLTQRTGELETAIIGTHLRLLADLGDTHIARRAGKPEADLVQNRARAIVALDWPENTLARSALVDFDRWLREPGKRRNPGSTADLLAACLFVALCERTILLPIRFASSFEPLP